MPGKHCALPACSNRQGRSTNDQKVAFHPFPKDILLRKHWISLCRSAGACKPDSYFICSHHFRSNDYVRKASGDGRGKRRALRRDALPSQNLGGPKIAARCSVKENRSLKRFCTLDALRNQQSETRTIQVTSGRTNLSPKLCKRCSELEEQIEVLKVKNTRLAKRIGALEAEILELIN
ncbi:hypothetical protein GE061_013352 [Apolygus lucorum]|uniref:Uncharacterized protein n=1 Tax=Apolygus lucorum TaxID=248454 RepID=A0A6A4K8D0_APOLU|nr:hypothetical protein GE061_013352 [Apolygus lucorum]